MYRRRSGFAEFVDEMGLLPFALLVVCAILIAIAVWYDIQATQEWDEYKAAHNCQAVGKVDGSTFTTVSPVIGGSGGVSVGVGFVPSKTGWKCDDGMTYWKNN